MKNLDVLVRAGGLELPVHRLHLVEALSVPTRATIEVRSVDALDLADALDGALTIHFRAAGSDVRVDALRLFGATYRGVVDGLHAHELDARASLDFLRLATDVRKFRDLAPDAIVTQVLRRFALPHRFELAAPLSPLPSVTQYRETCLDFVHRLMEQEGVHYAIVDDEIVFGDATPSAPRVEGTSVFDLPLSDGALAGGEERIATFSRGARLGSGRATVNDYDWRKPTASLLASEAGQRDVHLEVYEYLVGYRTLDAGKRLARLRVESYEARKRFAEGSGNVLQFRPRRAFGFAHVDGLSFTGEWLLTRVEHRFVRDGADGEAGTYHNEFEAIPLDVPYRPPVETPRPVVAGTHTAMVRGPAGEEIHTDEFGRFKAQFHWDREAKGTDEDSRWLRMVQEPSSSMVLARVGWEVSVGYLGGDPDRPQGLCRMINGQMVPTYEQPARQNVMTIKTESYPGKAGANELRIDDSAASQQIFLHAEQTQQSFVKNDQTERIGNDERYVVGKALTRSIGRDQKLSVGNRQVVEVDETDALRVLVDREKTVGGNETVRVKGALTNAVQRNDVEKVGAVRRSLVGGLKPPSLASLAPDPKSLVPDPKAAAKQAGTAVLGGASPAAALKGALPNPVAQVKAAISPAAMKQKLQSALDPRNMIDGRIERFANRVFSRTVGAAHMVLAGGNVTKQGGLVLAETIGGLKLGKTVRDGFLVSVAGKMVRTVLGTMMQKAAFEIGVSSESSQVTIGGDASLSTSEESVDLRGKTILIETAESLDLVREGLAIKMTPSSISLSGDARLRAQTLLVRGGPDDVTK